MTTSGTTTFNFNALEAITKAFHRLGKASEGEALSARMYDDGRSSLNLLLKAIGAEEHLWTKTETTVTLVSETAAYALTPKPLRVLSVRRDDGTSEIPLNEMARQDYFNQPNKTDSPSTPVSWYYDPQATTGTLYVWPAPASASATLYTLNLTVLRRIEDIISANDDIDAPQEWQQGLIWLLANDLETEYPVNDGRLAQKIERQADFWWAKAKAWDNEPASIFIQPDYEWC
jgi:hypothetical protein